MDLGAFPVEKTHLLSEGREREGLSQRPRNFHSNVRCLFRVVAAVLQDAGRQPPEDDMEESLPTAWV